MMPILVSNHLVNKGASGANYALELCISTHYTLERSGFESPVTDWNDAALLLPRLCARSVLVAVQISFAFVSSFFLLSGEGILSRFSCDLERFVSDLERWYFVAVLRKFL